jgi:hypothetical protein
MHLRMRKPSLTGITHRPSNQQLLWMGLRALLASLLASVLWLALYLLDPGVRVEVTQLVEYDGLARIYYSDGPVPYAETRSRRWEVEGGEWRSLSAWLPGFERHSRVRIDPMDRRGLIVINKVVFESEWARVVLRGEALVDASFGPNDVLLQSVAPSGVRYVALGADPHFSLVVPRVVYWPDRQAVFWLVLRVAVGVFLLWLLLERLWWWLERHHPKRSQALRSGLRDLPSRAGRLAFERPARLIAVLTLVLLPALLAAQYQTARITPFFQGPDEGPHVVNTYLGFDRIRGAATADCLETWPALAAIESVTARLAHHPMVSIRQADVDALAQLADQHRLADVGSGLAPARYASCASGNLYFSVGYNLLAVPLSLLRPDANVLDYLQWVRQGQSLVAALLLLLTVVVIARGEWLPARHPRLQIGPIRVWLFLAVVAYVAIPQQVFLGSVVGPTAHLVPLGLFVFVSFLFRVRGLTELGLLLAVLAFVPRRAAFVLPLVLLLGWYLALWLRRRWRWRWAVHALVAGVVVAAALAPQLVGWVHGLRDSLPVYVPVTLMMVEDPGHYYRELAQLAMFIGSLSFLDWTSFFGLFGWLDTELPRSGLMAYRGLLLAVGLLCLFALHSERARRPWRGWWRSADGVPGEGVLMLAVALPVVMVVATYLIFELRWLPHLLWGQTMQGRYLMPLLFPALAIPFLVHALLLAGDGSADATRHRRLGGALVTLLVLLMGVVGYTTTLMLGTLANRYYESPDVMVRYLDLLR